MFSILLLCWKTLVPGHPLGPVINMMSVWGTGKDCKGHHLVLCVWHELTRVPTAASSSSCRGRGLHSRRTAELVTCVSGTESSTWRLLVDCQPVHMDVKLLFISTVIKIYEIYLFIKMCLVQMQRHSNQCCQHRLTPMHIFRCVSWWLSTVSWTWWQDWNVSNLLLTVAWEICGQSSMVLLSFLHSSSSASSRCCLDMTLLACHMYCANKCGK